MYPTIVASSPRLHVADAVEFDDLVSGLGGGFGSGGCVHASNVLEEEAHEVLLELHLRELGSSPFELGRWVAVGEGGEVDSRQLGDNERLGRERYLLLL